MQIVIIFIRHFDLSTHRLTTDQLPSIHKQRHKYNFQSSRTLCSGPLCPPGLVVLFLNVGCACVCVCVRGVCVCVCVMNECMRGEWLE